VGFADPLYFSRAVKRQYGLSPTHLRRRHKSVPNNPSLP